MKKTYLIKIKEAKYNNWDEITPKSIVMFEVDVFKFCYSLAELFKCEIRMNVSGSAQGHYFNNN